VNPERLVESAARPIFEQLFTALEDIAEALEEGDLELAEAVLDRTRRLDEQVRGFDEVLAAGHETARLSPTRRRSLKHLELYASASIRMELAVINTRVLARGAANAIRRQDRVPEPLPRAVLDLSRAVRALASYLEEYEAQRTLVGLRWRRRAGRHRHSMRGTISLLACSSARFGRWL